jgi:hypothetical protein
MSDPTATATPAAALTAAAPGADPVGHLRWMEAPATTGALIDACLARLEDRER